METRGESDCNQSPPRLSYLIPFAESGFVMISPLVVNILPTTWKKNGATVLVPTCLGTDRRDKLTSVLLKLLVPFTIITTQTLYAGKHSNHVTL